MPEFVLSTIEKIAIHNVGNKLKEQELKISENCLNFDENIYRILGQYFLNSFKSEGLYHLSGDGNVETNELFQIAAQVFSNRDTLFENSIKIAERLYEYSAHPQIKGGELFVAYIEGCVVENQEVDALGIFKCENKDTFLKVFEVNENFVVNPDKGININKLDKGCLIYNLSKEDGFLVSIVDAKREQGNEAQYWKDEFIHVKPRNDEFNNTANFLNMYKRFCDDACDVDNEIDKKKQVDLKNKARDYFEENEKVNVKQFEQEVIASPNLINSFREYKEDFQQVNNVEIIDEFGVSEQSYKNNKKFLKSVIKLDKNFHVYVHGAQDLMEKGVDDVTGMKFYKLFYESES